MNNRIKRASRAAFIFGILTFLFIGAMFVAGGNPTPATLPNQHGFTGAIYWFEVVENPAELFQVLGEASSDRGRELRAAMDLVNRIDFAFMACYSLFFALLFIMLKRHIDGSVKAMPAYSRLTALGVLLSIVMLTGDVMENLQLLKLTAFTAPSSVDAGVIGALMIYTRIKWFAIFAACLVIPFCYRAWFGGRWRWALFALPYGASAVTGALSFFVPSMKAFLELSANLMGVAWLISMVHTGIVAFKKEESL